MAEVVGWEGACMWVADSWRRWTVLSAVELLYMHPARREKLQRGRWERTKTYDECSATKCRDTNYL